MVSARKIWLKLAGFPDRPVFYSSNKLELMEERNIDILVDDRPSTIDTINKAGKIGLQFKPPYMNFEIDDKSRIITHLSEVKKWV